MRKVICFFILIIVIVKLSFAQNEVFKMQNYHPVSPSAFQFLKYDEMPVSEYTGIPNISIPIYNIETDGVNIPIKLTYHAGGNRVNDEASWVGLGWDLTIGSIIQEVNDQDDYGLGVIQKKPDYHGSPNPSYYSMPFNYGCGSYPTNSYPNPIPVINPQSQYAYTIYRAYYMPINGDRLNQFLGQSIAANTFYDSEPDIFTANFCGHSIKFIRDQTLIKVINNVGYKIVRTNDEYHITTPQGEIFVFEKNITVNSYTGSISTNTAFSSDNYGISSRIWMLTKIITKNKKNITFSYLETGVSNDFPKYSDYWNILTNTVSSSSPDLGSGFFSGPTTPNGVVKSTTYSSSTKFFLKAINFPNGHIDFNLTDRDDIFGEKKLSSIQINSPISQIKSIILNYSYFDASSIGGNKFETYNGVDYSNVENLRLKLTSLNDNTNGSHNFFYDETPLPSKKSLAQDFWGFYNGKLTNTSLIPNPSRLQISQTGNLPGLSDNGNNNSALLNYCQASILKKIQFPTGGTTNFIYELNQFDNYILPDYYNIDNTISNGNGLRIKKISYQSTINIDAKISTYEYYGGKALTTKVLSREFFLNHFTQTGPFDFMQNTYSITQINGNGFYSTSSLGSGTGVGYNKVIRKNIDANNVSIGRTETVFTNIPDDVSNSNNNNQSQINVSLPVLKKITSSNNGDAISISIFNNENQLIKKINNTYSIELSDIYYGARFFDYGNWIYPICTGGGLPYYMASVPETMVGYYPIYDKYSTLVVVITTDYDKNNNPFITKKQYDYNSNNLLIREITKESSNSSEIKENINYLYLPYSPSYTTTTPSNSILFGSHRFTESMGQVKINSSNLPVQNPLFTKYDKVDHEFIALGDKIVKSKTIINNYPGSSDLPSTIYYNKYDISNANLQEYKINNTTNSILWNYNGEYVSAEISNGSFENVAATSFEGESKGNWLFTGLPINDATTPTGRKCYFLNGNNNIQKIGLLADKVYTLTYWIKYPNPPINPPINTARIIQTLNIAGTVSNPIIHRHSDGWTLVEHKITGQTSINITGNAYIDELRLYPVEALMNTFTFDPLIGITSNCDANNKIIYYQYDSANRLSIIRDEDKNIIKKICYNFLGDAEDCPL